MKLESFNKSLMVIIKIAYALLILTVYIFLFFHINTGRYSLFFANDKTRWLVDSRTGDIYWYRQGLQAPDPYTDDTSGFHKVNYIKGYITYSKYYNSIKYKIDQKLKQEKWISDSIRVQDSMAMVRAEQLRVEDSIVKVNNENKNKKRY